MSKSDERRAKRVREHQGHRRFFVTQTETDIAERTYLVLAVDADEAEELCARQRWSPKTDCVGSRRISSKGDHRELTDVTDAGPLSGAEIESLSYKMDDDPDPLGL